MLFTFPSRYWFAIGLPGVFSLAGWSRLIHAEFLVIRATQDTAGMVKASTTGLSPAAAELSSSLPLRTLSIAPVLQPRARLDAPGLGSYRFARHYSGNHFCFLFLRLLRCFSSAGSLLVQGAARAAGSPIRTSADQRPFAPSRGFSQLVTSFFASESQGILRSLLVTYLFPFLHSSYALLFFSLLTMSKNFHPSSGSVENNGFEPLTPCLQSRCSSQLS